MANTNPIYLNTASCGLLDPQAVEATNALYSKMLTCSSIAAEELRDKGLQRIRQTIASFLQAPVDNIAFIPNFSYALNAIVQALKGTEKVMLYRNDYPSVLEPFRINHFDITWIEAGDGFNIDIEELKASLLANKIDVLAISHVQWMSGYKLDIKEVGSFCAANNIAFIVDATQSMGAVPILIDELDVDVLIASNYKWMNGGFGAGIMYMSDAFLKQYTPVVGGNASYAMVGEEWKYTPSLRSYEPGHLNLHGLLILEIATNKKLEAGIKVIEQHNMHLTQQLVNAIADTKLKLLGPADMSNRSPIVLVKATEELQKYLLDNNVIAIYRNGYVRISITIIIRKAISKQLQMP
jgi:cysteine desulfurase/selenocysteine lyase